MSRPPSHPRQQPRRRRDPERGAVAVSAYLFMLVMLGLLALSLNTGILMDTRTELQTGSDSASLAAAGSLDGTMDGIARARSVAASYSAQHRAFDETIAIDPDSDVTFGKWHLKAGDCTDGDCFTEMVPSTTNVASINAVKVDNGRDGDSNSRITLPFGDFVGAATSTVTSESIAIGPGVGQPACSMPFVLADCKIRDSDGDLLCGDSASQLVLTDANADAIGFVNLDYPTDTQSPSGTYVADYIESGKMCSQPSVGKAHLNNGNSLSKVIEALRGENGTSCLIGQVHNMAVTTCEEDSGGPGKSDTSTQFQGVRDIVGFVQARIVAVTDNHKNVLGCGDDVPTIDATPDKNMIVLEILCEAPAGNPGGVKFGDGQNRVRIVR